jgi:hypothetical protein
LSTSFVL